MEEISNQKRIRLGHAERILKELRPGEVVTSNWLGSRGLTSSNVHNLKTRGVLTSLGSGAYVRGDDIPLFSSAIEALVNQLQLPVHIGGSSALSLQGVVQYLSLGAGQNIWLFSAGKLKLPTWFSRWIWDVKVELIQTNFLTPSSACQPRNIELDQFYIKVSSREQAILEAILLIGKFHRFEEIDELFEGLTTLNPELLQKLLETCNSIRVCRIFLYLARKHNHPWAKMLKESTINLGSGKRTVVKNGRLDTQYLITVPQDAENLNVSKF